MAKLNKQQRAAAIIEINGLRLDLLRMQRALERGLEDRSNLSDFQATGQFNSALHRWRRLARVFAPTEVS